jgi:hypothetical protein
MLAVSIAPRRPSGTPRQNRLLCWTTVSDADIGRLHLLLRTLDVDARQPQKDQPDTHYEDDRHHPVEQNHQKRLFFGHTQQVEGRRRADDEAPPPAHARSVTGPGRNRHRSSGRDSRRGRESYPPPVRPRCNEWPRSASLQRHPAARSAGASALSARSANRAMQHHWRGTTLQPSRKGDKSPGRLGRREPETGKSPRAQLRTMRSTAFMRWRARAPDCHRSAAPCPPSPPARWRRIPPAGHRSVPRSVPALCRTGSGATSSHSRPVQEGW